MNKEELLINNFKDELLFALSLELKNKLTDKVVYQLEYETNNLELDKLNEDEDLASLTEYLELAKQLINKHYQRIDNETLVKKQFYISKAQLSFLDDYADKKELGGKGKRSLALRTILNEVMKD